jgi:hypothetical protein
LAAGVFQFLKENVVGMVQQDPTPDLEPDTLAVLAGKIKREIYKSWQQFTSN